MKTRFPFTIVEYLDSGVYDHQSGMDPLRGIMAGGQAILHSP